MQTSARFLVLLFVLVAAGCLSTAYLVQGGDCHSAEECNLVVPERKAMQDNIIGGKMVSDNYSSMKKMEMMNGKSERSKIITRKSRKLMHRENYRAKFVAFNADYKGPRHHPPKNN